MNKLTFKQMQMQMDKAKVLTMDSINAYVVKDKISAYGKIETCEVITGMFHIFITEGFSIKATNVLEFMKTVMQHLPEYPVLKKFTTDQDYCYLVLAKLNS